jgi:CheY-like chemotaxis protein
LGGQEFTQGDGMASVLIVEDEALIAFALIDDLAIRGHHVREAADGAAALDILKDFSPDVLVTDMTMPRLDGAGLIRNLRARAGPRLPIILLTGVPEAILPAGLGYDAYLSKPVDNDMLGSIVARLAGAAH